MKLFPSDLVVPTPGTGALFQQVNIGRWRQLHHAAQAVVEIGKSWGTLQDDDSHSALVYQSGFCSVGADGKLSATLDFSTAEVRIDHDHDPALGIEARASRLIRGMTRPELAAWVRAVATRLAGEPKQDAVPAPDLPEHPVANGSPFFIGGIEDEELSVAAIYLSTYFLLLRFVDVAETVAVDGIHELTPRLWPHHFDLASLLVVDRDQSGAMMKTIGVGVTPPDDLEASGYWYVSPWRKGGSPSSFQTPELPHGRWLERGDVPMAIFPLEEMVDLAESFDASQSRKGDDRFDTESVGGPLQATALAEFTATAFNACYENLTA